MVTGSCANAGAKAIRMRAASRMELSKVEFQRELELTRRADGAEHDAAGRDVDIGSWSAEARRVCQIKRLCPKLKLAMFGHAELLEDGEIQALEVLLSQDVRAGVSVGKIGGKGERCFIEPIRDGWIAELAGANTIRTLPAQAGVRHVA